MYAYSAINITLYTYDISVMKMKAKIKNSLLLIVTVTLGFLLICERETVALSVSDGISVCGDVLIPSLFPFMVLSAFSMSSGIFDGNGKTVSFIMNKIFRLPSVCFPAVLFGFTGGYPVGARVITGLYEDNKITASQAKHLLVFCVNAGPAFIVSAAGGMVLGSRKAGYVMLFSACISSLLIGVTYGRINKRDSVSEYNDIKMKMPLSDSLVSAVTSSCSGILSVCSWVLVFSAFSGIIRAFLNNNLTILIFDSLSEVTSGLKSAAELGGVPFVSACIAFGGFCIMCQLLPYIKKCGMKTGEYLLFRIINSILTFAITKTVLLFTDISVSVYSEIEPAMHYAPASAALMIMCSILIFHIASVKDIRYRPCLF